MAFSIDHARNQFVGPNIEPDPKIFTLQNCLPPKKREPGNHELDEVATRLSRLAGVRAPVPSGAAPKSRKSVNVW